MSVLNFVMMEVKYQIKQVGKKPAYIIKQFIGDLLIVFSTNKFTLYLP